MQTVCRCPAAVAYSPTVGCALVPATYELPAPVPSAVPASPAIADTSVAPLPPSIPPVFSPINPVTFYETPVPSSIPVAPVAPSAPIPPAAAVPSPAPVPTAVEVEPVAPVAPVAAAEPLPVPSITPVTTCVPLCTPPAV